jgi:hypothetical protein
VVVVVETDTDDLARLYDRRVLHIVEAVVRHEPRYLWGLKAASERVQIASKIWQQVAHPCTEVDDGAVAD